MRIPKDRIHGFVACTARRWHLNSRVTLVNKTGDDAVVSVAARSQAGKPLAGETALGRLAEGESRFLDVTELSRRVGLDPDAAEEHLFTFTLVPAAFEGRPDPVEISREELMRIVTAQDHYIEHYDPTTWFSSGVLYQTPPINDRLVAPHSSFLMQAPKVFVTPHRNTVFQVLFLSRDPDFSDEARLSCRLREESGRPALEWEERLPPHGMIYIDVRATLERNGVRPEAVASRHGFLFFEAACADHSFVPLTFNVNERLRTFDLEHSLPPTYYASAFVGPRKGEVISAAVQTHARHPEPLGRVPGRV